MLSTFDWYSFWMRLFKDTGNANKTCMYTENQIVFLALTTLTYTDEKFKFLGAKISFKDEYDIWYIHVYEI